MSETRLDKFIIGSQLYFFLTRQVIFEFSLKTTGFSYLRIFDPPTPPPQPPQKVCETQKLVCGVEYLYCSVKHWYSYAHKPVEGESM